jgi:non-lysosomal glucosylceramidase
MRRCTSGISSQRAGELGAQPEPHNTVGVLCLKRTIPAGQTANFEFFLGWRFPNRTPDWIGWDAPPGEGKTVIGNAMRRASKTRGKR